jgi:hypothetical protein
MQICLGGLSAEKKNGKKWSMLIALEVDEK